MGVPILRLPFVALKVLVDNFNRVELVAVSLLSKRADWFLKTCGKKNVSFFNLDECEIRDLRYFERIELFLLEIKRQGKLPDSSFGLHCELSDDQRITVKSNFFFVLIYFEALENIEKFEGIRRNLKIGEALVPVVVTRTDSFEMVRLFWSNKTQGMMAFIDYFKNGFNLSIEKLEFRSNDSTAVRTVVNHINSTQTVVKKVEVDKYSRLSDAEFKFILENVPSKDCFTSYLKVSQNFKFDGTICAKSMYIRNGYWFTFQNLLKSNECEKIFVDKTNYTTEELRTFLREWKSGKFPKLREVELVTNVTWRNYLDVTRGFERRRDKCDYFTRGRAVVAIKGQGDFYGIVDPYKNMEGRFHMRVHY